MKWNKIAAVLFFLGGFISIYGGLEPALVGGGPELPVLGLGLLLLLVGGFTWPRSSDGSSRSTTGTPEP